MYSLLGFLDRQVALGKHENANMNSGICTTHAPTKQKQNINR
jgi:hypothetical protein